MAHATELSIGTGQKVSLNYQSQEVSVSLTYQLEREDTDVLQVVQEKVREVAQAHRIASDYLKSVKENAPQKDTPQECIKEESVAEKNTEPKAPDEAPDTALQRTAALEAAPPIEQPATGQPSIAQPKEGRQNAPAAPGQLAALRTLLPAAGWNKQQVQEHPARHFACPSWEHLKRPQAEEWLLELQRFLRERNQEQRRTARLNGSS